MVFFNVQIMLIMFGVLFNLNYIGNAIASGNCLQNQFIVDGRCCESCLAGKYVAKNCTEHTSTSCKRCRGDTFQEETNGRECHSCKMCDAGTFSDCFTNPLIKLQMSWFHGSRP
ncbi:unnamed protein product [Lota lota]